MFGRDEGKEKDAEYWREYFLMSLLIKPLRKYRHRVYMYRCTLHFRTNTRSLCGLPYTKASATLEGSFSSNDSAMHFSEGTLYTENFQIADCLSRGAKTSWKHNKKK